MGLMDKINLTVKYYFKIICSISIAWSIMFGAGWIYKEYFKEEVKYIDLSEPYVSEMPTTELESNE